jgi:hypothetical protein
LVPSTRRQLEKSGEDDLAAGRPVVEFADGDDVFDLVEAGTSVASPIAKRFGFALDRRVCWWTGKNPSLPPRPAERPT